jgi:hypothetical protein
MRCSSGVDDGDDRSAQSQRHAQAAPSNASATQSLVAPVPSAPQRSPCAPHHARAGVRSTFGPVSLAYEPGLKVGFGADRPNGRGAVRASAACGARARFSLQAGGFSRAAEFMHRTGSCRRDANSALLFERRRVGGCPVFLLEPEDESHSVLLRDRTASSAYRLPARCESIGPARVRPLGRGERHPRGSVA